MKQSKKEFFPNGVDKGKRAILFNLHKTNTKEFNSMTLSQKILAIAFLEDCKNSVQMWIKELTEDKPKQHGGRRGTGSRKIIGFDKKERDDRMI